MKIDPHACYDLLLETDKPHYWCEDVVWKEIDRSI